MYKIIEQLNSKDCICIYTLNTVIEYVISNKLNILLDIDNLFFYSIEKIENNIAYVDKMAYDNRYEKIKNAINELNKNNIDIYIYSEFGIEYYSENIDKSFNNQTPELNIDNWKEFKLSELFDIVKGNNATKSGSEKTYPYVSSASTNNGISDYKESGKYHPGGLLTVSANGACMDTFYQPNDFISCGDVNVLYPKFKEFNKYNAMFFIPILELEKFRFGYGRKSTLERVKKLTIKLPVDEYGEPDYQFMENYIKTLPYSKYI